MGAKVWYDRVFVGSNEQTTRAVSDFYWDCRTSGPGGILILDRRSAVPPGESGVMGNSVRVMRSRLTGVRAVKGGWRLTVSRHQVFFSRERPQIV